MLPCFLWCPRRNGIEEYQKTGSRTRTSKGLCFLSASLQVLLDSHKAWYMRQRCDDPFDSLLGLDKLKAAPGLEPPFTSLKGDNWEVPSVFSFADLGHTHTTGVGLSERDRYECMRIGSRVRHLNVTALALMVVMHFGVPGSAGALCMIHLHSLSPWDIPV